MAISDILKEEGCHLTPEGIETLGIPETTTDPKIILKKVLDLDLREIGAPAFPEEFCKSGTKCETLEEPVFVQVQKVRNISAPKANEESKHAPRMLKLILTDGHLTCQAIEVEHISCLSINTPPGTKLQLKSGPLTTAHGFLFVGPTSLKVLGGHVTHMVDKWELNKSLAKHTRGGGGEGAPPPWIPFGQPLDGRDPSADFKSLQDPAKLDNVEFEAQRKGAIAEAQKMSGTKKVFGGGTKPMLDTNVQKIVDAGFSEEQAENTLKLTRNNADRALKILQKREGSVEAKKERPPKQPSEAPTGRGGRKGRSREAVDEDGVVAVKPSGKVSLFDFLEDKLPAIPEPEKPAKSNEPAQYFKEDTRQDRSNNADRRGGHSAKGGGRGGPRGAGGAPRQNFNMGHNNRNEYPQSQNPSYGHNDSQRNYNNYQREDRPHNSYNSHQVPNEKAPRFQKKHDGEVRRQQTINMPQESPYPPAYHQPVQSQPSYNPERRNMNDNQNRNQGPRNFYSQPPQPPMESLAEAAANLNLEANPQNRFNSRPNVTQNNYPNPNNFAYPGKPAYNNQNNYTDQNFKRGAQFVNSNKSQMPNNIPNGQPMGQSFYSPYPEPQAKIGQNHLRQPDVMEVFRQQQQPPNPNPDQRNNFATRGNGFYQANNIVGFQNASINEQARKMLAEGSEINWSIGDRCHAKYWEDNTFYDAEITGVSARTVVVRFLAYGNHEEVLKTDCLPPNTPVGRPFSRDGGAPTRGDSRPGRFHQPMYVPPAQRKP